MTQRPPVGIFLVRAWWEDGRFRARITSCLDINSTSEAQTQVVTAEPNEVSQHLAAWLRDLREDAEG